MRVHVRSARKRKENRVLWVYLVCRACVLATTGLATTQVVNHNLGTTSGKQQRVRSTQTRACAGHNRDFAIETKCHWKPRGA